MGANVNPLDRPIRFGDDHARAIDKRHSIAEDKGPSWPSPLMSTLSWKLLSHSRVQPYPKSLDVLAFSESMQERVIVIGIPATGTVRSVYDKCRSTEF